MVLEAIHDACVTYYNDLPEHAIKGVLQCAAYSFIISSMFRNTNLVSDQLKAPLVSAGTAAVAGLIHTLASPFFKYLFGVHHNDWQYQFVKMGLVIGAVNGLGLGPFFGFRDGLAKGRGILWQTSLFISPLNIPYQIFRKFRLERAEQFMPYPYIRLSDNPVYIIV